MGERKLVEGNLFVAKMVQMKKKKKKKKEEKGDEDKDEEVSAQAVNGFRDDATQIRGRK